MSNVYILNAAGPWALAEDSPRADRALGAWAHCYDGPLATVPAHQLDGRVAVELPEESTEEEIGRALRAAWAARVEAAADA
jgi:hypothetical protein